MLSELVATDDDGATHIWCDVVEKLHVRPAPEGFKDIVRCGRSLIDKPCPPHPLLTQQLFESARREFVELLESQSANRFLLHTDLHHGNILKDATRGWLVIDPKGYSGELEFETASFLHNPTREYCQPTHLERRVRILSARLGMDEDRLLRWCFAHGVLSAVWSIEMPVFDPRAESTLQTQRLRCSGAGRGRSSHQQIFMVIRGKNRLLCCDAAKAPSPAPARPCPAGRRRTWRVPGRRLSGPRRSRLKPNWIAGTSIGAINAAIIAGNAPDKRVERLREFWETASATLPFKFAPLDSQTRSFVNEASAAWIATAGVAGFFRPRIPPAMFYPAGAPQARSYYDTSPLRDTLERLVDFDRINAREVRLSLGAVKVKSGELIYFDNERHKIGPEHVMASGALPPGFPAVEIDGNLYWDGGVVSNTPLQYVLDEDTEDDLLVFQVDLFSAHGPLPNTVLEAIEREKDIRYSSRTRRNTEAILQKHDAKMAIRSLLNALPPSLPTRPTRNASALSRARMR